MYLRKPGGGMSLQKKYIFVNDSNGYTRFGRSISKKAGC